MNNLLDKLHNDHKNFIRLLTYIEHQLQIIKDCDLVDFQTIQFSIEYMKDYSDVIHHPQENIIFKYFIEHYDLNHNVIHGLMDEHEIMPTLTEKIIDMLECVISDVPISRAEFCEKLSEYINIQKNHMDHEESDVYPILYKEMTTEDWKALTSQYEDINDPLFGHPENKKYQELLNNINSVIF